MRDRGGVAGQGDSGVRLPTMFLAMNNECVGKQCNFVTEQLERDRAGQEGGIHENTFAEGNLVGHGPWLGETERGDG